MAKFNLLLLGWMACCLPVAAQLTYVAADLRPDGDTATAVGIVNPYQQAIEVTLSGFGKQGVDLGSVTWSLPPFGQIEKSSNEVFASGSPVWLRVDSATAVSAYVRYAHQDGLRFSLAAMSRGDGPELWISQLTTTTESGDTQLALVNTAAAEGQAFVQPLVQGRHDDGPRKAEERFAVPGFGPAHEKTFFAYESAFDKTQFDLFWDRLAVEGGARVAGVQHFGDFGESGAKMASMAAPRTSHREMFVAALHPNEDKYWTRFVLANIYDQKLPIVVTAYYEYENINPTVWELELAPFEKAVYDFNDFMQVELPGDALWYRITPHEGGLLGFQLTGSDDGKALGAAEALRQPASVVNLPYTPSDARLSTSVGLVNPTGEGLNVHVGGFDANGRLRAHKTNINLGPFRKKVMDTDTLFGAKAADVVWTRVWVNTGSVLAYSVINDRDGGDMAVLEGQPSTAIGGLAFFANFEHSDLETLKGQGWYKINYNGQEPRFHHSKAGNTIRETQSQYFHRYAYPAPGNFFMESQFQAKTGIFYLGYEPVYAGLPDPDYQGLDDRVAYLSPPFEAPNYGDFYISYHMRFINPELATPNSEYGLVIREEGSTEWIWFGLLGDILLDPPLRIGDCWTEVYYRCDDLTLTPWLPFEIPLPDRLRGKRIQVGLYYYHLPDGNFTSGPTYFIDDIRLSGDPLYRPNFFESSFGTFTFDENAEEASD